MKHMLKITTFKHIKFLGNAALSRVNLNNWCSTQNNVWMWRNVQQLSNNLLGLSSGLSFISSCRVGGRLFLLFLLFWLFCFWCLWERFCLLFGLGFCLALLRYKPNPSLKERRKSRKLKQAWDAHAASSEQTFLVVFYNSSLLKKSRMKHSQQLLPHK